MATVSTKMVLDTSGFNKGIKSAESSIAKFKSMAGGAAMAGVAAGFAAATAAAVGLAVGVKNVLDIGGALSDLSTRTGVAAGELRVLQEAFKQNGLSAEQVGPAINKLQRALIEAGEGTGPAVKAFEMLGMSAESLRGMDASSQFQAIGAAINALPDPAARAAAAMQIFGRSGGELLTLFANGGAMSAAATTVGAQAELLTKNANMFDQASDILGSVGTKLEGFFVGVADQIVPAIMPLLEAANSIDLASIGQDLGQAIAFALTAITSGQIGNLLTAQFKLSAAGLLNDLYKGFIGITAFLVQRFIDLPSDFLKIMEVVTQPSFWVGLGQALIAAALGFGRSIAMAVADLLSALREVPALANALEAPLDSLLGAADAAGQAQLGMQNAASANLNGPLAELKNQAMQSLGNALAAMDEAMSGASQIDTSKLEAARDGIVNTISEQMKANEEATRQRFEATKTQTPLLDDMESGSSKINQGVIAQSLQKVGGGAAFARFSDAANPAAQAVREQQKTNNILTRIENKLAPQQMALMPA